MITISIWITILLIVFGVFGFIVLILLLCAMWYVKHNGSITLGYYEDDKELNN